MDEAEYIEKENKALKYTSVLRNKQQKKQRRYNVAWRRVRESLLPWKGKKYYLLAYACVHGGNRARGRVYARTCI